MESSDTPGSDLTGVMADLSVMPALGDPQAGPPLSSSAPSASSALPANSISAAESNREDAAAPVVVGGTCPDPAQPTVTPPKLQKEETDEAPPASPSPDPSQPGPNLYPNVHITHNPSPAPGDVTGGQIPDAHAAAPVTAPVHPPLCPTAAEKESPPQQAQPPGGQPVGGQPVGGQPPGGQPVEGQPPGGQPVEGQPPGGQPVEGQLAESQPPGGQPVEGQPVEGQLAESQPVGGQPVEGQPAEGEPTQKDGDPAPPTQAAPPSPAVVPFIKEPTPPAAQPLPHGLPSPRARPAPDTLSYLDSASLMSGTLESLSGLGEDCSSVGSDSEVNGMTVRRTDKYGFLGGSQYSESAEKEMRVEVARQREVKWLDMFRNWDKWIKQRFQKVKLRCRKGIPSSLRARAWQMLSNSQELLEANPGKFEELEREQGEAKWLDIIEKDLHRQFPFHEMFAARGGHGQQDLYRILKAYTIYRPDEGYCQAQAPVAAVLLMHMPAEQAFWCLVTICEKYLPGYYSAGLEAIQLDGEIFFSLLRRTCPMAYRHLKKFKIDPILYMTEWFMCIFSRTLPWSCVLRVWDMFFCEGVKIIFRVGLVLLKQMLGSVDKLRELQGMYETMERLRNISPDSIKEEQLVQEIVTLPVSESLIERECASQVRKWRESRGELSHQPARRLHGSRDVFQQKRRAAAISSGGSFSFLGSGATPPPGPLRSSSSLLSLPGFRRSKAPLPSPARKAPPPSSSPPPPDPPSSAQKPPIPPGAAQKTSAATTGSQRGPAPTPAPSPKIVSEQITPTIPSPTANNAPLPPCEKGPVPTAEEQGGEGGEEEEGGKKKKKSKEEKKKEKEDEKKKLKERKEKEKLEKERMKKEKEKKKGGKKKERGGAGGGEGEEKNGAAAKETV